MNNTKLVLPTLALGLLFGTSHVMASDSKENLFQFNNNKSLQKNENNSDQIGALDLEYTQPVSDSKQEKYEHRFEKKNEHSGVESGEQAKKQYKYQYQHKNENQYNYQGSAESSNGGQRRGSSSGKGSRK